MRDPQGNEWRWDAEHQSLTCVDFDGVQIWRRINERGDVELGGPVKFSGGLSGWIWSPLKMSGRWLRFYRAAWASLKPAG